MASFPQWLKINLRNSLVLRSFCKQVSFQKQNKECAIISIVSLNFSNLATHHFSQYSVAFHRTFIWYPYEINVKKHLHFAVPRIPETSRKLLQIQRGDSRLFQQWGQRRGTCKKELDNHSLPQICNIVIGTYSLPTVITSHGGKLESVRSQSRTWVH